MSNDKDLEELVPWQQGPTERGGPAIMLSCLAVVITCTWTVLHLNVPGEPRATRPLSFLPEIKWMTIRKLKWMFIMIIFPEAVFAHAVVELRAALDDYLLMYYHRKEGFLKGWCINPSDWAFVLQETLSGSWPPMLPTFSSSWPWFTVCSVHDHPRLLMFACRAIIRASWAVATNIYYLPSDDSTPVPSLIERPESTAVSENNEAGPSDTREIESLGHVEQEPSTLITFIEGGWPETEGEVEYCGRDIHPDLSVSKQANTWTLTHCYFANMGGIHVGEGPITGDLISASLVASNPALFLHAPARPQLSRLMSVIRISKAEIQDKSKAVTLFRLLWI